MNKADLRDELIVRMHEQKDDDRKVNLSWDQSTAVIEELFDIIMREVANGGSVLVTGFGSITAVDGLPRVGRNPRTNEPIHIPAKKRIRYVPGQDFKDAVRDPGNMPKNRPLAMRRSAR